MNDNLVSYIIPIWSRTTKEEIEDSINSLKKEHKLIGEIIIVFDGYESFNKSFSIPKILSEKLIFLYSYINKGPGLSRNLGALFAKNEYLFFLDAGDKSVQNRITLQLEELYKSDACFGYIKEYNNSRQVRIRKGCKNSKEARKTIAFRTPFNNVTLAIKKKAFSNIGGYPNLRSAEDWVLIGKILKTNLKISCLQLVLVNVNIGHDFIKRRKGGVIFRDIKYCLVELHKMGLFNKFLFFISTTIQYLTRNFIPIKFLKIIYVILRSH